MEGENCSIHKDKMAIGYYSGSYYGLNGCAECIKCQSNVQYYNLENAKRIFEENIKREQEQKAELIKDDSKSISIGNGKGDNWVLFGKDKIDYLNGTLKVSFCMKFQDERSGYIDSSD